MKPNHPTLIAFALGTILLLNSSLAPGQVNTKSDNISLGFNLNQFQNDFGIGLNLTSPYFAKNLAIRLRSSLMWNEFLPVGEAESVWASYANAQLGILLRTAVIENKINAYSEGGAVVLFPSNKFSSDKNVVGGYGLFGFEFLPKEGINYFFEMGGIGTGAQTEKASIKQIYSNGFLVSVGMRFNL